MSRPMTTEEIAHTNTVAMRIAGAMRTELTRTALSGDQMRAALAIATSLVVSYQTMQVYLEEVVACAEAKEHAAQVMAGEEPELH